MSFTSFQNQSRPIDKEKKEQIKNRITTYILDQSVSGIIKSNSPISSSVTRFKEDDHFETTY